MRVGGTKLGAYSTNRGLGNQLWDVAGNVPSLDLRFADNKSLVDATTGQNLVSFTRASSGTYVDSQGVIRTATTNLCLQSENFTTTWTNFLSTDAANTAIAPNGTLTADTLIPDSGATAGLIRQDFSGATFTDNASISFSIYVKAAGLTSFNIQFFNKANTFYGTQTVNASTGGLSGSGTIASTTVTNVGDGWYRVSMTGISAGSGATSPNLRIVVTSTGDGTSGIYLWGAQLEQSSTVGEYIPTTSTINSAPRFDHNPTSGESLGLLVEESRTNLCTYSEAFDDASWIKTSLNGTITANQTTAPDGLNTADLYQEDANTLGRFVGKALSATSGTTYTAVFWAKQAPGSTRYAGIVLPAVSFGVNVIASYTLSGAGSVTIAASGTGTSASIQQFPNGWYRCSLTSQATVTISGNIQFRLSNSAANGAATYAGDGSSGLYIWGAQIEVGAFPTSYIPTTTATVTRSADVASISGSNFSSWYRQDEGTVFVDILRGYSGNFPGYPNILSFNDGTGNNLIALYGIQGTQNITNFSIYSGGVGQTDFVQVGSSVPGPNRISQAIAANSSIFAANGTLTAQDSTVTMPNGINRIVIGCDRSFVAQWGGHIRRLTYWPQRLSNPTIQSITQ